MKHRTFIAINPPESTKKEISIYINRLRKQFPEAKWVDPENFHLTLAFLGDVDSNRVAKIATLLKILSKNSAPFNMTFGRAEIFPHLGEPRLIWIKSKQDVSLLNLNKLIRKQLVLNRFAFSDQYFLPHFTLARFKKIPQDQKALIQMLKKIGLRDFTVNHLDIMESIARKDGPYYRRIFRIPLKNRQG